MLSRGVLLLLFFVSLISAFGLFSRPQPMIKETSRPSRAKQGSLKLCPPGGASFLDAFNLICPMRRRRRSIGDGSSSLGKIMNMCCETGCEFTDIFAICNPFG